MALVSRQTIAAGDKLRVVAKTDNGTAESCDVLQGFLVAEVITYGT